MDQLFKSLPDIIKAAAQSQLGILALLVVALSILAYVFFAKATVNVRVGIFVLLFAGVVGSASRCFVHWMPTCHRRRVPAHRRVVYRRRARALLTAAAADPGGYVLYEKFGASVDLHTNGVSL